MYPFGLFAVTFAAYSILLFLTKYTKEIKPWSNGLIIVYVLSIVFAFSLFMKYDLLNLDRIYINN